MHIEVGMVIRVVYGNDHDHVRHVLAIVDGDQVVYKRWSYHRRAWVYFVRNKSEFDMLAESGHIASVTHGVK